MPIISRAAAHGAADRRLYQQQPRAGGMFVVARFLPIAAVALNMLMAGAAAADVIFDLTITSNVPYGLTSDGTVPPQPSPIMLLPARARPSWC
jgi:hypothetical protein